MTTNEQQLILIDVILLAYRLGYLKHDEELTAMLAAAHAAHDPMGFMTALENFGVARRSKLFAFAGKMLSAPAFYRAQYPMILGLRKEGEAAASFLGSQQVLFLAEALLTKKQRPVFLEDYWWFVHNHEDSYLDRKKGWTIGAYATAPQDNASVLARYEEHLMRLQHHSNTGVRDRYETFPTDFILAILRRAFL